VSGELEALELELLLAGIERRWGYDFRDYAPAALRRRVHKAMRAEAVETVSALQERVLHQRDALLRFVATLSVPSTGMFRDPQVYRAMRAQVMPLLRTYPFVRIWHAGCASGEEAYSMAILLHEEGLLERCRIYATDMSDELLQQARRGVFPLASMRQYTTGYHHAGGQADFSGYYTTDQHHAILREDIRRHVVFSQHNLATDGPFNEFHLIVCRNVLLYFSHALRERVHSLFCESLAQLGVLAIGVHETLRYSALAHRYEPIAETMGLYRRIH
jgi:chemotaxis protein methyltransferase CheR